MVIKVCWAGAQQRLVDYLPKDVLWVVIEPPFLYLRRYQVENNCFKTAIDIETCYNKNENYKEVKVQQWKEYLLSDTIGV